MFRLLAVSLVCASAASAAHAQLATAVGVVVDSVRGRPLIGATIVVSGAEVQGVSDSSGRFRIDSIPPGDHTMAVLHPYLDEMGLSLMTNKITFAPGATMAVVLATPSAQTWIGRRCTDAERRDGPDAITGHVLQLTTDDPVTGVLVHYSGAVIQVSKESGFHHATITRDASASPSGDFIICGIPQGALGTVRAQKGRVSTGELPADLSNAMLASVTLRLAPDDTLPIHPGVVTGKIVDNKGAPVPAARVTVRGTDHSTQTSDSGTFALRELPLGTQVLDIDKLGYPRTPIPVNVLGPQQPAVISIALNAPPPLSDEAILVGVGFAHRREKNKGVFITGDTIKQRKARYIADLQPLMPGLITYSSDRGPLLVPTRSGVARCVWYFVDGFQYAVFPAPSQLGGIYRSHLNDDWPAANVVGIEYYDYGHIPLELLDKVRTPGSPRCSMIAIWTVRSTGSS
jgi:hypothetical protein